MKPQFNSGEIAYARVEEVNQKVRTARRGKGKVKVEREGEESDMSVG
jgi:hypothetical protein